MKHFCICFARLTGIKSCNYLWRFTNILRVKETFFFLMRYISVHDIHKYCVRIVARLRGSSRFFYCIDELKTKIVCFLAYFWWNFIFCFSYGSHKKSSYLLVRPLKPPRAQWSSYFFFFFLREATRKDLFWLVRPLRP